MTKQPTLSPSTALAVDPRIARAEFFFELDLVELNATIDQAAPRPIGVAKY
jgi:hypothetical protein